MEAYNNLQVKNFNDEIKGHIPHQLFKMSWTLTPNVDTILEMIIPGKKRRERQRKRKIREIFFSSFFTEKRN